MSPPRRLVPLALASLLLASPVAFSDEGRLELRHGIGWQQPFGFASEGIALTLGAGYRFHRLVSIDLLIVGSVFPFTSSASEPRPWSIAALPGIEISRAPDRRGLFPFFRFSTGPLMIFNSEGDHESVRSTWGYVGRVAGGGRIAIGRWVGVGFELGVAGGVVRQELVDLDQNVSERNSGYVSADLTLFGYFRAM